MFTPQQFNHFFSQSKFPQRPYKPVHWVKYLTKWLLLVAISGVAIGSLSAFFLHSLAWVTQTREAHPWLIALLPIAGFAIGWLYYRYGREVAGGNNLIIQRIEQPGKPIPYYMGVMVYLGTLVSHLFGGSAGREGTALQLAAAVTEPLSQRLGLSDTDRQTLLIAAVAAGFGSVFGTPLAGAVFAIEFARVGRIRYRAIMPAVTTSFFANWITQLGQAQHTHYAIGEIPAWSSAVVGYTLLFGICCGLVAWAFSRSLLALGQRFVRWISYPPLRPLIGGIIIATTVAILQDTTYIGLGIPVIESAFWVKLPWYAFLLKMAFTVVTLGAGFKGGEVTPLFFIGATLGSALSGVFPLPTGFLAGLGFIAVFAGATNTPLACIVMGMELFGIEATPYFAIACGIAFLISGSSSIYSAQSLRNTKFTLFKH